VDDGAIGGNREEIEAASEIGNFPPNENGAEAQTLFMGIGHFAIYYEDRTAIANADLDLYAAVTEARAEATAEERANGIRLQPRSRGRGRPPSAIEMRETPDGSFTTPGRRGARRDEARDRIDWFVPHDIVSDARGRRPGHGMSDAERRGIVEAMTKAIARWEDARVADPTTRAIFDVEVELALSSRPRKARTIRSVWQTHNRLPEPPAKVIVHIDGHPIDLHGTFKRNETIDGQTYRVFVPDEASKESALAWWSSRDQRRDQ